MSAPSSAFAPASASALPTPAVAVAASAHVQPYTPELARAMAPVYERMKRVVPPMEWPCHAPLIDAIKRLKRERNAIVLAHNYQAPEIFLGVADLVGDSLALAKGAVEVDADVIVMAGVHFMAETTKLLNPGKTVLIPDTEAGCSLASSITGADVRRLRAQYPGVPVVSYVNTTADVKAETDVCCTSSNAVEVVESLGVDRVLFLPDRYLAAYVATQTKVEIIPWDGHCEVHVRFSGEEIAEFRSQFDRIEVLAHPECPPDVLAAADFVGSTAHMTDYIQNRKPPRVLLLTECSMSANVAAAVPEVELVRPCNLCPHMRRITLPKILEALETLQPEVTIDPALTAPARRSIERMLAVKR